MRMTVKAALILAGLVGATQAMGTVTLYDEEGFRGGSYTASGTISNFQQTGFNDRAESVVVNGGSWEACEDSDFRGRCVTLEPGTYPTLARLGMLDRISSIRPIAVVGYASPPAAAGGPLHEVNVAAVHAVVGPAEQRCWIEREQVVERGGPNVPGAIIGGVLGGVLGHQIGGGRGKDVATAGGAVAGAAIGANAGRGAEVYDRDVQRCASVPSSLQPSYWDVSYFFNGYEHHAQLSAPPGPTLWVDDNGVPRA